MDRYTAWLGGEKKENKSSSHVAKIIIYSHRGETVSHLRHPAAQMTWRDITDLPLRLHSLFSDTTSISAASSPHPLAFPRAKPGSQCLERWYVVLSGLLRHADLDFVVDFLSEGPNVMKCRPRCDSSSSRLSSNMMEGEVFPRFV